MNSERHDVDFSVRRPGARRVEIAGEIGDWLAPQPLEERAPGLFGRRLALPHGVYAYKLRVDGVWELDPGNARTRAAGAGRNNVLAVGAAEEPLLFAPTAPFMVEDDRGGVVVACGLRRGAGARVDVLWAEARGIEMRRTPMCAVHEEGEHLMFRARLPLSASRAYLLFDVGDGARVGRGAAATPFEWERRSLATPGWLRDAVVYAIFVDRFRPRSDDAPWGHDPGPDAPAGGHLDGVTRSLDAIAELGADVVYLTPVHVGASCHRYDVVDPLRVDPALGGEAAFARLVENVHRRGMRLVCDFTMSHAGPGFPAFEEVRREGRRAARASWFQWDDAGRLACYGRRDDAPLFDLDSPDVRALALAAVEGWARRGVDGVRLDAAAEVPLDLARQLRARLRSIAPDAVVLGELVPAHAWRWREEGAIDAATDFAFQRVTGDLFARGAVDASAAQRALVAADLERGLPPSATLRFVSTHDHARFATLARASRREANRALGLVHLLASPGIPAILYGEEVGLASDVAELAPEAAWKDRAPMPWAAEARDERLRALVKRLLAVRARSPALRRGDAETLFAAESILVLRRAAEGEIVDVAMNGGAGTIEVEIADDEHPAIQPLVTWGEVVVQGARVTLGAGAAIVARRAHGGRPGRRLRIAQLENAKRRDEAFEARALGAAPSPTRIDFALTEACNLRCRHCITAAPEKTRSGAARALSPWLLDRVRDALAFAEYVGFVHGGESLASPLFFDVLRALRAARAGFPYVAHLLTNGVLLGERTTARLVEEGVRSISVSLDGASASVNDAVREGGRFEAVVRNVEGAVRVRRELGADLRLGISTVVMQSNLSELEAVVELAARLGVDWVKLEEVVPVNVFAARSLVRFTDPRATGAITRAIERGRTLGIVVVDHTAPPAVWRCRLGEDPAMRAFLEADEFANRSTIFPCRAPYEHACIEPNGDVRVGDFFGAVVGNVAELPLATLWNGPAARAERQRAEMLRLCGSGAMACARAAD